MKQEDKIIFLTSHGSIKFLLHKREKRTVDCPLELYRSNSFFLLKASGLEINYDTDIWVSKRNCWVNWRGGKTKRMLGAWMGLGNHDPGNKARIKYFHLLIHLDWIFTKNFVTPFTIKTTKKDWGAEKSQVQKFWREKAFLILKLIWQRNCLLLPGVFDCRSQNIKGGQSNYDDWQIPLFKLDH